MLSKIESWEKLFWTRVVGTNFKRWQEGTVIGAASASWWI
jgi:hypothetical protein